MRLTNTKNRFGLVTIFLHWFMAFLMIALLGLGLYMVSLPISLNKLKLYGWHKEYGFLLLFLTFIRLFWCLSNTTPVLSLPLLEKIAACWVHWSFYACMFSLSISGWLVTSSAGLPASFFGLFLIPNLIQPNESYRPLFHLTHQYLSYALIVLIILHTSAALKHTFINKDNMLKRMLR